MSALGDVPKSVCMDRGNNPFSMIELLDAQFASMCTFSLFAVLFTPFGKRYNGKEDMARYTDELQQHFAQQEHMGSNAILKEFKNQSPTCTLQHGS